MYDGNLYALRQYENNIDAQERKEEFIEKRAVEISEELRAQKLVKINGDVHLYHVEQFMDDCEIEHDTGEFCAILTVDADGYEQGLDERFWLWCVELAESDIDNEEQPCEY